MGISYRFPKQIYLSSVYSSIPYCAPSLPIPDSLIPPKAPSAQDIMPSLTPTIPLSSLRATRQHCLEEEHVNQRLLGHKVYSLGCSLPNIVGVEVGGQSHPGIIGESDHVFLGGKLCGGDDGAENLLLEQFHVRSQPGEDRWLEVESTLRVGRSACTWKMKRGEKNVEQHCSNGRIVLGVLVLTHLHLRSLGLSFSNQLDNSVKLTFVDHGTLGKEIRIEG